MSLRNLVCFGKLVIFNEAILKPRLEGRKVHEYQNENYWTQLQRHHLWMNLDFEIVETQNEPREHVRKAVL